MKKTYEEEDDLKELLELEMLREAQKLEENLLSEEELDDLPVSDEETDASFQKLIQRLKDEGVYRADGVSSCTDDSVDMDAVAEESKAENTNTMIFGGPEDIPMGIANSASPISVFPHKRHFPVAKVAGFSFTILLAVFAGSMTSEANRKYLIHQIRFLQGDNSQIVASNYENVDKSNRDESEAIRNIETKLGVNIPIFYYKPDSLYYESYFLDTGAGYAVLQYGNSDNRTKIHFYIYNNIADKSSISLHNHGDRILELPELEIEVIVREVSNKNSEPEFSAIWEYQDVIYNFAGRMEWNEFEKIINSIQFEM